MDARYLKLESMFYDFINFLEWEIAFSVIPTTLKPVKYAVWERDPKYAIRTTGMVRLQEDDEIPQTLQISYFDGRAVEKVFVTGIVERVPQYITVLGARERPVVELPAVTIGIKYGGCESEGSKWVSLAEMLAKDFPLKVMKKLHGGWRKRTEEEFFSSRLRYIEDKIAERYEIAEIDFGFKPTIRNVYETPQKLPKALEKRLVRNYGEKSTSVAVI